MTDKRTPPPIWKERMTVREIVDYCLAMDPRKAAALGDSSLCVTPLITCVIDDDGPHELSLVDGKWAGLKVRVSSLKQRSNRAARRGDTKRNRRKGNGRGRRSKEDGYSEEDQLIRGIRYMISKGYAFKIYNDSEITGEFPANKPHLIQRLLKKKTDRFRRVFETVFLDPNSLTRRPPEQVASMRAYLEERICQIESLVTDEASLYTPTGEGLNEYVKRSRRGRPRTKAMFRQAFTQLLDDIADGFVHLVAASDRSRLNRDADMETEFLQTVASKKVRLVGVIEDMSHIDVASPLKRGISYLLGSINENKLEELATCVMRGKLQALESGRPPGTIPWWLELDDDGFAVLRDDCEQVVRRIISLALMGYGDRLIAGKLREEGVEVDGKPIEPNMVWRFCHLDPLQGNVRYFGLKWRIYPVLIDDPDVIRELGELRARNRDGVSPLHTISEWSNHLLTGITRCCCGRSMRMNDGKCSAQGEWLHYYSCSKSNKKTDGSGNHGSANAAKLEAFVGDLVAHNPLLLTGALSASLGAGETTERIARRALLEEHVERLSEQLKSKEVLSRQSAEDAAKTLGISPESERFDTYVAETVRLMHEPELAELEGLKRELAANNADCARARQNERFNAAVAELGGWDNLDVLTRKRLLRSVIESITLYPRKLGGKAVIKLVGIDTPLPPVWFAYGRGSELFVPTVGEWIESAFDPIEDHDPRIVMNANTMTPFYQHIKKLRADGSTAELVSAVLGDKTFPIRTSHKPRICNHLEANGASDAVMQAFEEVWRAYIAAERERIRRRLDDPSPA